MIYKRLFILILFSFLLKFAFCQDSNPAPDTILPGAYRLAVYLPYVQGKRVGVFANQTSMVGQTHLVDTLRRLGINIVKIFQLI